MLLLSMLLLVLSDHLRCLWRRKVLGLVLFVQTVLVRHFTSNLVLLPCLLLEKVLMT
jgi:hypothetical protein